MFKAHVYQHKNLHVHLHASVFFTGRGVEYHSVMHAVGYSKQHTQSANSANAAGA